MYGKKVMGIERTTFLIAPDGTIRHLWRKVKPEGHPDEVLAYFEGQPVGAGGPRMPSLAYVGDADATSSLEGKMQPRGTSAYGRKDVR